MVGNSDVDILTVSYLDADITYDIRKFGST
jgi:hypothetical protein